MMKKGSVRYQVLLYLCTDPAGSWTQKEMLSEFVDMGKARTTVLYAIQSLKQRGLIDARKDGRSTVLSPTHAGTQAIRPYLASALRAQS